MLALAMVITSITFMPQTAQAKKKKFDIWTDSYLNCIKISWKKYKKAKKYVIHRAVIKDTEDENVPKRKKFKVIKKTKKLAFKDKKAKRNVYYTYYVDVIGKKGKLLATSYTNKYFPTFQCKGFDIPEIDNRGTGDGFKNSPSKIYVQPSQGGWGYYPKKKNYVIYRKKKNGNDNYKKINAKLVDKEDHIYLDNKVEGGEYYLYKCKTYVKKGKKKYYSKFSKPVEVAAVNYDAALSIDVLTPSQTFADRNAAYVDFKVTDVDRNNARVLFFKSENDVYSRHYGCYQEELEDGHFINLHDYDHNFVQYSKDGITWTDIPRNGVALPKLGSLYLRMQIYIPEYSKETEIVFAGPDSNFAISEAESIAGCCVYDVPGSRITSMFIDFVRQKISVSQVYD